MKNIFIKSFKVFKKNLFYFFLIELAFTLVLFFFIVYARNKIQGYVEAIQSLTPDLLNLQGILQESADLTNLVRLETVLDSINSVANSALLFGYFIIPLIVFLILHFFHSLNYKIIHHQVKFNLKYLLKFFLVSVPYFLILVFAFIQLLGFFGGTYFNNVKTSDILLITIAVLFVIVYYFTFLGYSSFVDIKKGFRLGIKKFKILFPLYLLVLGIIFTASLIFLYLYVLYIAEFFTALSILYIFVIILLLLALDYLRVVFVLLTD